MPDPGRNRRAENPRAIPVSELLARRRPTRHPGDPEPGHVFVGALLEREGHRADRPVRQMPRIVGAIAAVAVLSGVLMATTHSLRSPDDGQVVDLAAPQHITGSRVFQPDLIKESLEEQLSKADEAERSAESADSSTDAQTPATEAPGDVADGDDGDSPGQPEQPDQPEDPGARGVPPTSDAPAPKAEVPAPTMEPTQPPAAPTTSSQSGGLVCNTLPILCPVLGFYETAPDQPQQAYQMLDTSMRDSDVQAFARSWDGITEATVDEAEAAGGDRVEVQVTLVQEDGSRLVAVQLITVSLGEQPRITNAELLAVQYVLSPR